MALLLIHGLHCCMEQIWSPTVPNIDRHCSLEFDVFLFLTTGCRSAQQQHASANTEHSSLHAGKINHFHLDICLQGTCHPTSLDLGGGDSHTTISLKHQESKRQQQYPLLLLIFYNLLLLRLDRAFGSSYHEEIIATDKGGITPSETLLIRPLNGWKGMIGTRQWVLCEALHPLVT